MGTFQDPTKEIFGRVLLSTAGGDEVDLAGFTSLKMRLQLGAADELTINMPAQNLDGEWRSDMGVWQVGSTLKVEMGYDGELFPMQEFEITSSTVAYPESGGENFTIRGVSELARAARNRVARAFESGDDRGVVTQICDEYGWNNGIPTDVTYANAARLKEAGKTDLELLKRIAREARLGGPRVQFGGQLIMPSPEVGTLRFARGLPSPDSPGGGWRRCHSINMNRDGGQSVLRVRITGFDPDTDEFVTQEFEADPFGGQPKVTYEGRKAATPIEDESTQSNLTLQVVEHRGQDKRERIDVLASGVYRNEDNAIELARRWFELREKLSRWSTIVTDGHPDLFPYSAFELDGNMANMDKGIWLPLYNEHTIDSNGWKCSSRAIRVVEEASISAAE